MKKSLLLLSVAILSSSVFAAGSFKHVNASVTPAQINIGLDIGSRKILDKSFTLKCTARIGFWNNHQFKKTQNVDFRIQENSQSPSANRFFDFSVINSTSLENPFYGIDPQLNKRYVDQDCYAELSMHVENLIPYGSTQINFLWHADANHSDITQDMVNMLDGGMIRIESLDEYRNGVKYCHEEATLIEKSGKTVSATNNAHLLIRCD